jgi:hypothetical protein
MPANFTKKRAKLSGDCTVDEAEDIFSWMRKTQNGDVDVAGVSHLHAAVLQAIMATQCKVIGAPQDLFVAECMRQTNIQQTGLWK